MRRYALALVGLVAVAVWLLLWDSTTPVQPPAHSDVRPDSSVSAPEESLVLPEEDPADDLPTPVERLKVDTGAESVQLLSVIVRDSATGQVVPGATVTICDYTRFGRLLHELNLDKDMPEARRLEATLSVNSTTDATGSAQLPLPTDPLLVEARKGDRWGLQFLREIPDDRTVEIILHADRSLHVRVTDLSGRPRLGVPVSLRCRLRSTNDYSHKTTATGEDGVATLFHLQRRLASMKGWEVAFAFPVVGDPALPVDENTPASPPRTLVLEGAGSMKVRLRDEQGQPVKADAWKVHVTAFLHSNSEPFWPKGRWSRASFDENGEAVVPWLGLGLKLRVKAQKELVPDAEVTAEIAGPTRDGEQVLCDLVLTEELAKRTVPFVTGRLVRRDGRPWSATTAHVSVHLFPTDGTYLSAEDLHVDEGGRFRLNVKIKCPKGGARRYRLLAEDPYGSGQVITTLDLSDDVPQEGLDVGDVILDHGPMLVSGQVIGSSGEAIAGVRLRVLGEVTVQDRAFWPRVPTAGRMRTADDGTFEIYMPLGEPPPLGRLKLSGRHPNYRLGSDRAFAMGESSVTLVVEETGGIEGSLIFRGDLVAEVLHARLESGRQSQSVHVQADGTFKKQGLPPGEYRFEVTMRGAGGTVQPAPAVIVEQVIVRPGVIGHDPRLQGLAVQVDLARVRLKVVDQRGVPLRSARAFLAGSSDWRASRANQNGVCELWAERLPVDVKVVAFGYRHKMVRGVTGDQQVVLEEGIAVRLVAGTRPHGKDPPWRLGLHLREIDAQGGVQGMVYGSTFPVDRKFFDERGEIRIRLPRPGTYEIDAFVSLISKGVGVGGSVGLQPSPQITVAEASGEQVFRLNINQQRVDAAVQKCLRE